MADKFQLKAILTAVDKISGPLKNISRASKMTHKSLRDIGNAGGELMRKIGLPAFASFSAITFGAYRASKAAMDYAGAIQDAADRTGAGVTEYQTLANMLGLVGGTAEDAEMAFTKFNKGMADGAAGVDKNFAGLMRKLQIPLKDAKGNIRSLADTLPDLAAAFEKNKNPAVQTRMAMELFSKGGAKMIPILNKGREGLIAWIKEQERLGVIVSQDSVAALDDMGDSAATVGTQIKALQANALAKLVPVIKPIIDSMSEWLATNKEWLQTEIVTSLTQIAEAIKQVDWKAVIKDFKETVKTIATVVEALGGLKGIVIGMGLAFIAGPIAAIFSIIGAVFRATTSLGSLLFMVKKTKEGYMVLGAIPAINSAIGASFIWLRGQAVAMALAFRLGGAAAVFSSIGTSIASTAALMAGKLLMVGKAVLTIGRALLLTPLGIVIGLATAAYLVYQNWDKIKQWFVDFGNWIGPHIKRIASFFADMIPDWVKNLFSGNAPSVNIGNATSATQPSILNGAQNKLNGEMVVRFENAPQGMRADVGKTNQSGVRLNPDVGYRPIFSL